MDYITNTFTIIYSQHPYYCINNIVLRLILFRSHGSAFKKGVRPILTNWQHNKLPSEYSHDFFVVN